MPDDGAAAHLQLNAAWKTSYDALLQRARRGGILVLLESSLGYRAPIFLIGEALDMMGMPTCRETLQKELDWLVEKQLLTLEQTSFTTVAKLTQQGSDIAKERAASSEVFIGDVRPTQIV